MDQYSSPTLVSPLTSSDSTVASRKRCRDEAERSTPAEPQTITTPQALFFPITLYIAPEPISDNNSHQEPISLQPTPSPLESVYDRAIQRVANLTAYLTPSMQSSLTSLLSTIHQHLLRPDDSFHPLILHIASPSTSDATLLSIATTIDSGLHAFSARGGRPPSTTSSQKSKSSSRSEKVRSGCKKRDSGTCYLTGRRAGETSHILPFSLKTPEKGEDFWKFVALFQGVEKTEEMKIATLGPGESPDSLRNVWWLTKDVHDFFDKGRVAIIPSLTGENFPYDPSKVEEYNATVEFPIGASLVPVSVFEYTSRSIPVHKKILAPGDTITFTTADPVNLPLPHPILFQLHAIISRIIAMKAAAGFLVITQYDDDEASTVDSLMSDVEGKDKLDIGVEVMGEGVPFEVEDDAGLGGWVRRGKRRFSAGDLETGEEIAQERPRKVAVVMAEYEQRMEEKRRLARERFGDEIGFV